MEPDDTDAQSAQSTEAAPTASAGEPRRGRPGKGIRRADQARLAALYKRFERQAAPERFLKLPRGKATVASESKKNR